MENNARYIEEDEIDLRELFNTIVKRKWFILVFTSIVTIGAIIWALTRTPIYEVKSNVQIGFIGEDLITEPNTLIKIAKLVFNVEDKVSTKENFVSEVTSISSNKKLENFIEIQTQAISNDEALKKNKEVVAYIENKYQSKIDQFILNNNNNIKAIEKKISNLKNLETKNLKRQIELLKTQNIVKIDEKIEFYKKIKIDTLTKKIQLHTSKLKEYTKAVNQIYQNNKENIDSSSLTISSLQMVNYQNLILNSQNKVEDLKIEIETITNEIIPNLLREKKNIQDVTIKDLQLKIDNINNISIVNLEREKKNIQDDTLRQLEYKLKVDLPNRKVKLLEQIEQAKFLNSKQNIQNSKVIGQYIVKNYPIKPKKKLIVTVAFTTGFILSIFLVFFLEFINNMRKENHPIKNSLNK